MTLESIKTNLDKALKKNNAQEDSESDDDETDELENDDDFIKFLRYYNELLIRLT